jgi:hypothetical protein
VKIRYAALGLVISATAPAGAQTIEVGKNVQVSMAANDSFTRQTTSQRIEQCD